MSKRILVVCYPGNEQIRNLAESIARHCDADLEWIKDRDKRLGLAGQLRSMAQALLHSKPWIQPARCQPAAYPLVIIGTPVWARSIASPVRSYLERHGSRCRRVAFFCTHTGAGADRVLADMQVLCGSRPVDTLALNQQLLRPGQIDTAASHFVRRFSGHRGDSAADEQLVA